MTEVTEKSGMKTILIVDDEPAARYGLRRALEAKYRIAEADSAEAARAALNTEQPDLVLARCRVAGAEWAGVFAVDARAGKRRAGADGFGFGYGEDGGGGFAAWARRIIW